MRELQPPELHYLRAASGWLDLGLPEEARFELQKIGGAAARHLEVLALRWELSARAGCWEEALEIAQQMVAADESDAAGWINRSYALHELRRTTEARESLLPALPRFPDVGLIPYNLACYACQMGDIGAARGWLREAIRLDGRTVVLDRAAQDADLVALRGELGSL